MDKHAALQALSALAQDTRLDAFRLLVNAGGGGMAAGAIAAALSVRQNTMSANLSILQGAGLIRSRREGRVVRYFADMDGMQGLLGFLLQDCCNGRPDVCAPVLDAVLQAEAPREPVRAGCA